MDYDPSTGEGRRKPEAVCELLKEFISSGLAGI
jgi:hypothetical protein